MNNINFSSNTGIGGAVQLSGTGWTVAAIVSYYCGVPLVLNPNITGFGGNDYGVLFEFLPGAYGIGDILNKAGYKNYFILGSDIEYGGRDKFFKSHKDTIIFDYHYFHDNNYIPDNYKVWWGIEDRKLYQFAKNKIAEITQEEPFFITILTADSHFTGGYLDEQAEIVFDSQYKNVLRDMSKQLYAFLEWLCLQPFYESTTVVILGDHLYMDSSFFLKDFRGERYPINIFINSVLPQSETKRRVLSHFDILPLLVESIGGSYNADGLALGRSLNVPEGKSTLIEKYGVRSMNEQLGHPSKLYNSLWSMQQNKNVN
jgi:phosphoglycerol transferase